MKRLRLVALTAGLITAASAVYVAQSAAGTDTDAVTAVLMAAIDVQQNSFIPATYRESAQHLSSNARVAPEALRHPVNPDVIDKTDAAGRARISSVLQGNALAYVLKHHENMIAEAKGGGDPGFRPLDGGVEKLTVKTLLVDRNTAMVQAEAVTWAEMAQVDDDGAMSIGRPQGPIEVQATLRRSGDTWKVSDYHWEFPAGTAP